MPISREDAQARARIAGKVTAALDPDPRKTRSESGRRNSASTSTG
jgi:hypothetical protein